MSESPEVANDPPAIGALRSRRRVLERAILDSSRELARVMANKSNREAIIDRYQAELDDIDNAIKALSYPNPYGGISTD